MALFEELVGGMEAMESDQIAMVLLLVGVILLFLIVSATKRGGNKDKAQVREPQRNAPTFEPVSSVPVKKTSQDHRAEPVMDSASDTLEIKPTVQPAVNSVQASDVPQDSILRRHYETLHKVTAVSDTLPNVKKMLADAIRQPSNITIEQAQMPVATAAPFKFDVKVMANIPEDSILKRHFMHQLKAEIQAGMSERPSDSILMRHYDSHIGYELTKRLGH